MRCVGIVGVAVVIVVAGSLPAAAAVALDASSAALVAKRWPQPYKALRQRLAEQSQAKAQTTESVVSILLAAADFIRAEHAPEPERANRKSAAGDAFRVGLDGLGADASRFLGRDGGLGEIARDVLGQDEFLRLLDSLSENERGTASVLSIRAEALYGAGRYAEALTVAREVLRSEPNNREMLTVSKFSEDRVASRASDKAAGPPPPASAKATSIGGPIAASVDLPEATLPAAFRHASVSPPPLGKAGALDPKAPDYWDRQLLAPLLVHSDANPVAREYLSPLILDHKVKIKLESLKENPELEGDWGYYDVETGVIHYNLDDINDEIRHYDAYYGRRDPARRLALISSARPLDPAQVQFLAGRFLPLAVHEAGGHATHSAELARRLGALSGPLNKDTEIMAWRLEAAAIAAERRNDPRYLTEATPWARAENDWVRTWQRSRSDTKPRMVTDYLDGMSAYSHLVRIGQDPEAVRHRYAESIVLVQANCRVSYGPSCGATINLLAGLYPEKQRDKLLEARTYLDAHPKDDVTRGRVMNALMHQAVEVDRLDPRGITVVAEYYAEEEKRVARLESLADPLPIWQKVKALWSK